MAVDSEPKQSTCDRSQANTQSVDMPPRPIDSWHVSVCQNWHTYRQVIECRPNRDSGHLCLSTCIQDLSTTAEISILRVIFWLRFWRDFWVSSSRGPVDWMARMILLKIWKVFILDVYKIHRVVSFMHYAQERDLHLVLRLWEILERDP